MSGTSARHTYDHYQAKWDKWDNDEFVEQQLAEAERDDVRSTPVAPVGLPAPPSSLSETGAVLGGARAGQGRATGIAMADRTLTASGRAGRRRGEVLCDEDEGWRRSG